MALNCCICDLTDLSHGPAGDRRPSADGPRNRPGASEAEPLSAQWHGRSVLLAAGGSGLAMGAGLAGGPCWVSEDGTRGLSPWPGSVTDPQCDLVSVSYTVQ